MTVSHLGPSRSRASIVAWVSFFAFAAIMLGAKSQGESPKIAIYDMVNISFHLVDRSHDPFHGPEGDAKRAEIRKMMADLEAAGGSLDEAEQVKRGEAIRHARRELMAMRPNRGQLGKERRDAALAIVEGYAREKGYSIVYQKEFLKDTHGGLLDLRQMTDITDEVIVELVEAGLASETPSRTKPRNKRKRGQ